MATANGVNDINTHSDPNDTANADGQGHGDQQSRLREILEGIAGQMGLDQRSNSSLIMLTVEELEVTVKESLSSREACYLDSTELATLLTHPIHKTLPLQFWKDIAEAALEYDTFLMDYKEKEKDAEAQKFAATRHEYNAMYASLNNPITKIAKITRDANAASASVVVVSVANVTSAHPMMGQPQAASTMTFATSVKGDPATTNQKEFFPKEVKVTSEVYS